MAHRFKMVMLTWLAVFPVTTAAQILLDPLIAGLLMPVRTLVVTVIMVPLLVTIVMPKMMDVFGSWLSVERQRDD